MEKRICILYTGGTIGMVPSEKGYVPSSGAFLDLLRAIPDLYWADMPRWDVVEFDPLLDSSDITVREWNQIGRAIAARYDDYDGFVVLHGTDTMAYSASAISFMLENLSKPVIFTGSQIPLGQIRSDGRDNIISSLLIAASGQVHEVCIYFNGVLLRGNRSTKRSSDQFEAFESPNDAPLAHAGIQIEYKKRVLRPASSEPFRLQPFKELPIGVIKIFPGIQFDYFESLMTDKLKGVVLETFGAGNIPGSAQNALLPIIDRAYKNGTIITVCSQCSQGAVSLGTYAASSALRQGRRGQRTRYDDGGGAGKELLPAVDFGRYGVCEGADAEESLRRTDRIRNSRRSIASAGISVSEDLVEFRARRCEIKSKSMLSGGFADRKHTKRLASVSFSRSARKACTQSRRSPFCQKSTGFFDSSAPAEAQLRRELLRDAVIFAERGPAREARRRWAGAEDK